MTTIINPQASPQQAPPKLKPFSRLPIYRLVRSKIKDIDHRNKILAGLKREYSTPETLLWQTSVNLALLFSWHDAPEGPGFWADACMEIEKLQWS